jgi:hypothetical protein
LTFALHLVGSECTRLPQHGINKGGLAMIYVSDDCYVAQVIALLNWQSF